MLSKLRMGSPCPWSEISPKIPVAKIVDPMAGSRTFFQQFEVPSNLKLECKLVSKRKKADIGETYQMLKVRCSSCTYSEVVKVKD